MLMASTLHRSYHHDNQQRQRQTPKKQKNNRLAFAFAFLFLVFLLGVLLFSKRSLEPSTSAYTSLSLFPPSKSQVPESTGTRNSSDRGGSDVLDEELGTQEEVVSEIPESVHLKNHSHSSSSPESDAVVMSGDFGREKSGVEMERCDLYSGSWVEDEDGRYPLYSPSSCPYVDDAYTCQENGRKDEGYLKWRWKPHGCELPRFNATEFLERIRGRRLMLVGDSMNRNQFESMLCLLREGLADKSKMYETRGYKITKGRGYFIFKFVDYDCSVEFCRSHFLVREGMRKNPKGKNRPTLMIDRIDKSSSRWKRANILIFNTGHWWTHGKTSKGRDYYQEGDVIYSKFDPVEAFRRAMTTWGRWIDSNMNPQKSMIFYRGYSTAHFRGGDWDSGGTCNGEAIPIFSGPLLNNYPLKMRIVEDVIREMRFPVILLNVTTLTNFRKDGHPSIYGKNRTLGERVSSRKQDCSHWCLPGVPDTWNELIYANLILDLPLLS